MGVTGWLVNPELSQGDVWFVHPFGFDFEFYIVPDPPFESLLAASNTGVKPGTGAVDSDYQGANVAAHNIGLAAPKGVLGVETDQGLVPPSFRSLLTNGSRVAAFGRWIVDCGHDDFHTEIHAPLLLAVATPAPPPAGIAGASAMTSLHIMSRPYTVSQAFAEGNFIDHLLAEVAKVETTFLGIPLSTRVEAHPTIFTTPYDGRPYIKLLVQPPPRKHVGPGDGVLRPQQLMVSFHFTHRTGVALRVFDAGNGTVGIVIVLGDLNPARLPAKHDLTVQWDQLGKQVLLRDRRAADRRHPDARYRVGVHPQPRTSSPTSTTLRTRAARSTTRTSPHPSRSTSSSHGPAVSEDDAQPFPVYGWLNVWWQDQQVVAKQR